MYSNNSKIISNIEELSNYIEGYDVYNSKLVDILQTPNISKVFYEITVYEYRPDLIAKEFYGSTNYQGLILLQTGLTLLNLTKGTVLELIPKETLDNLLRSI